MKKVVFINDSFTELIIPNTQLLTEFSERVDNEKMFRQIISFLISNKSIQKNIIDSGSWIGDNSIPWAKNLDQSIVYAIDPSSDNCEFIRMMSKINDITNVVTIQVALSDTDEILATNDNINHCTFNVSGNGINKVRAQTLDYLYSMSQIKEIDFIHLDVEGMENKVIKGATHLITNNRPIIAFEQHLTTDNFLDLCDYLRKKFNYCVCMINEILPMCRLDCRNFISFPDEKVSSVFFEQMNSHLEQIYPNHTDVFLRFF